MGIDYTPNSFIGISIRDKKNRQRFKIFGIFGMPIIINIPLLTGENLFLIELAIVLKPTV